MFGAKLFQKAGDKKSAKQMAQSDKEQAVKYDWNFKEAVALLKTLTQ